LVLAWLAWDEPEPRPPASLVTAPSVFPGAEKSYAVLSRYNYNYAQPQKPPFKWTGANFSQGPEQGRIWTDFLADHRAEIGANWTKLAPVRAWIDELNAFGRIADLHDDQREYARITYQVRNPYVQNAMAVACLLAIDGQGDAALATLRPMLEVGGKLEEGARGVGYFGDARALQAGAIRAAGFVLDNARVSAAARAGFATALAAHGGGPAGAGRVYAIRYAFVTQATRSFGRAVTVWLGDSFDFLRPGLDLVGPVVFNRHATQNRWGEFYADLQGQAGRRELGKTGPRLAAFLAPVEGLQFKDIGGAWVARLAREQLGLNRIAEQQKTYWDLEDKRAALLARLAQP
jgi:hypothetical protein